MPGKKGNISAEESTTLHVKKNRCDSPNGIISNEKNTDKGEVKREKKMRIVIREVISLPARQPSEIIIGRPYLPSPL